MPEIKIPLTPEQQQLYTRENGLALPCLEVAARDLMALVLFTEGLRRRPVAGGRRLFTTLALTPEQTEQIRRITGKETPSLALVQSDQGVIYRETWGSQTTPTRVGRSFVIGASTRAAGPGDRIIVLKPNAVPSQTVFGTGTHPTTRLALGLMEEHVRPGDRVLDLGTGSGVLAIAAVRLGAREVLALDVDPDAVAVARENVTGNGVADRVQIEVGGIEAAGGWPCEVALVNILATVLISHAPSLARVVAPSGIVIGGGVTAARVGAVAAAFSAAGFHLEDERALDEWRGLVFRLL